MTTIYDKEGKRHIIGDKYTSELRFKKQGDKYEYVVVGGKLDPVGTYYEPIHVEYTQDSPSYVNDKGETVVILWPSTVLDWRLTYSVKNLEIPGTISHVGFMADGNALVTFNMPDNSKLSVRCPAEDVSVGTEPPPPNSAVTLQLVRNEDTGERHYISKLYIGKFGLNLENT